MDSPRGSRPVVPLQGGTVSTGGIGSEPTQIQDTTELMPGMFVGEYQIEGPLGRGGMGSVYAAIHPVIAKRAAIKVLHPELSANREAIDRFVQEARAVNQIGHANIVDIFAFGALPDGRNYYVMECLRGESLRTRVRRMPIAIADTLAIVETITLPLEAAHRRGIVHRDLKPDNVFLVEMEGDRPQVKLLDFGIAKLTGNAGVHVTQTGAMLGTPAYISPEQARGENVDTPTDIYALGAMLFELATGELPFGATNAADMIARHLFEPPRRASQRNLAIPAQLDDLIIRMMAKDPAARPSLAAIRDELRACRALVGGMLTPMPGTFTAPGSIGHAGGRAGTVPLLVSTLVTPGHSPRPWIVIGIAVVAVVAIGAGVAIMRVPTPSVPNTPAVVVPDPPPSAPLDAAPKPPEPGIATSVKTDPEPHAGSASHAGSADTVRPVRRTKTGSERKHGRPTDSGSAVHVESAPPDPDAPM